MEILRDPLWNNIRLDPLALACSTRRSCSACATCDSWASPSWCIRGPPTPVSSMPSAPTISRAWHCACSRSRARCAARRREQLALVRAAALLHDVGHYPFSHALEEIGVTHHEQVARPLLLEGRSPSLAPASRSGRTRRGVRAHHRSQRRARCRGSSRGRSTSTRSSTSSAMRRCAACRTARSMSIGCSTPSCWCPIPSTGARRRRARKGTLRARVAAVREVSDVSQRVLASRGAQRDRDVQATGGGRASMRGVSPATVARFTDEELLVRLDAPALPAGRARACWRAAHAATAQARLRMPGGHPRRRRGRVDRGRLSADPPRGRRARGRNSDSPARRPLLDYPAKTQMLGLELPMLRRDGRVELLTAAGWEGAMNLPRLSDEFYRSARRLRVFTADRAPDSHRARPRGEQCGLSARRLGPRSARPRRSAAHASAGYARWPCRPWASASLRPMPR